MTATGVALVASETLNLSKSPTSELAAAAVAAQNDADLERADFIVVAVTPGELGNVVDAVRRVLASS